MGRLFTFVVALSFYAFGCSPELDAELFEVESVAPARIELGTKLRLRGAGFPAGREARVELDGEVRRPGEHPRRLRLSLPARARSSEEVEFTANARFFDEVGGRGSFRGEIRVRFPRAAGRGSVSGRLARVELDFAPSTAMRLEHGRAQAERAAALLDRLGLTLFAEEEGDAQPGLRIAGVRPESAGARAGLLVDDRIESLDGLRLDTPADFLPPAGAETTVLRVRRPSRAERLEVRLPLDVLETASFHHRRAFAWGAVLFLLLFAVSPVERGANRLARRLAWPLGTGENVRTGGLLRDGIGLAIFGGLPLLGLLLGGAIDTFVLLAIQAVPFLLAGRITARRAVGFLVCAGSLGGLLLLVGTTELSRLAALQGLFPWGWLLVRHPGVLAFAVAFVLGAAASLPSETERPTGLPASVLRFGASGIFVAVFLGPVLEPSVGVAAALFLAKALGVQALVARLSSGPSPAPAALMTLALGVALSFAWALGWMPPSIERISPPLLTLGGVVFLVRVGRAKLRARRSEPVPVLYPFL